MNYKTIKDYINSSEFMVWRSYYNMVSEFQETFSFEQFDFYNQEAHLFRESLIDEELKDLIRAQENSDLVGYYDVVCDYCYVLLGSLKTFENAELSEMFINSFFKSIKNKLNMVERNYEKLKSFDRAFREVHESNMSKACQSLDAVYATMAQEKYKDIEYEYTEKNGVYFIKIAKDYPEKELKAGKLLKSIDYKKSDLSFVLGN